MARPLPDDERRSTIAESEQLAPSGTPGAVRQADVLEGDDALRGFRLRPTAFFAL
jgi:hypothetical protein